MLVVVLECTMGTIDTNSLLGNWIVQRVKKMINTHWKLMFFEGI
jgi:hypothetical protein